MDEGFRTRAQVLGFGLISGVTLTLFSFMHHAEPQPFMDEIFHIPQARRYCYGKFKEWDTKITTLPGLYLISVGILNPISTYLGRIFCDPVHLRLINVAISSISFLILHRITTQIHGGKHFYEEGKGLLSALNLAIFPLLYFFTFLYYTDVGSTFMVLLMYCLHLDRKDWFASFIGLLAVSFRQTNIIWVAFVACQAAGPFLLHSIHTKMLEDPRHPVKFSLNTRGQLIELFEGLYFLLLDPRRLIDLLGTIFHFCGGYILVGVAFVGFVIVNEGVVVGDRDAHQAVFHPTQILYFCLFSLGFSAPFCLSRLLPFLHFCRRHPLFIAAVAILMYTAVNSYTLAHPYLLADNRHYTFYLWRRLITRTSWSKYVLIPLYLFGGFCVLQSLKWTSVIFKVAFPLFVCLNLVPQLLLEFRYFIIPYLLYRLQVRPQTWWKLIAESCCYIFVNSLTIYLYTTRTFIWEHEPDAVQRFIW